MSPSKVVVHTDIILAHVYGDRRPSVLRKAMSQFFCYTTVFNAIELFAGAGSEHERKTIEDALSAMKVLGLNPKNAKRHADLFRTHARKDPLNLLVAGLCLESKLPLLTGKRGEFSGIQGLRIVSPGEVLKHGALHE